MVISKFGIENRKFGLTNEIRKAHDFQSCPRFAVHMCKNYKDWLITVLKWFQEYVVDPILWISFNWTSQHGPKNVSGTFNASEMKFAFKNSEEMNFSKDVPL